MTIRILWWLLFLWRVVVILLWSPIAALEEWICFICESTVDAWRWS